MAQHSAFEKKYVEKDRMSDVEGLLEHFNLPPGVISFIRRNVRAIQVGLVVTLVAVVSLSLYSSYKKSHIAEASSALGFALEQSNPARTDYLRKVVSDYSGTNAATWATIELAHNYMASGEYSKAFSSYGIIKDKITSADPLYPLILFGQAEALEAEKEYQKAHAMYEELKDFYGYSDLSFLGMARTWEARGDIEKAIMTYNDYLLTLGSDRLQTKEYVEGKIVRLQSQE